MQPVFSVSVSRNLVYGAAPGPGKAQEPLLLDLYQPAGDDVARRPAIVFVHGGGFKNGRKTFGPSAVMAKLFAELGYVTVSIDYRLLAPPGGCVGTGNVLAACETAALAAVHDAQTAVRWLRAHQRNYRIDAGRIAVAGESAGAITATVVGLLSSRPSNRSARVEAFVSLSGGVPHGMFVQAGDPPGILFSGTADHTVDYKWSVETAQHMRRAGIPVELVSFKGAGHVPWQYRDVIEQKSIAFLYRYLGLRHADH